MPGQVAVKRSGQPRTLTLVGAVVALAIFSWIVTHLYVADPRPRNVEAPTTIGGTGSSATPGLDKIQAVETPQEPPRRTQLVLKQLSWLDAPLELPRTFVLSEDARRHVEAQITEALESTGRQLEARIRDYGEHGVGVLELRFMLEQLTSQLLSWEAGEFVAIDPVRMGSLDHLVTRLRTSAVIVYMAPVDNQGVPAQVLFILQFDRFPRYLELRQKLMASMKSK